MRSTKTTLKAYEPSPIIYEEGTACLSDLEDIMEELHKVCRRADGLQKSKLENAISYISDAIDTLSDLDSAK